MAIFLVGRIAFKRDDKELIKTLLYGLTAWLVFEAGVSAYLRVWFNVGVDAAVLALFAIPLFRIRNS
jgi:hypothetical protein